MGTDQKNYGSCRNLVQQEEQENHLNSHLNSSCKLLSKNYLHLHFYLIIKKKQTQNPAVRCVYFQLFVKDKKRIKGKYRSFYFF